MPPVVGTPTETIFKKAASAGLFRHGRGGVREEEAGLHRGSHGAREAVRHTQGAALQGEDDAGSNY